MKRLGTKLLTAASLAVILSGAACTKSDKTETNSSSKAEVTPVAELKTFNYSRTSDPKTLDPQGQLDGASATFISSIYDRIIDYHYLKRPYEMIPVLLKKMPELSKDGLTYTFELKEGINFHDNACFKDGKGRELVAEDVLYTMKRFADININANSWFMMSGAIEGLDEFHALTKKKGKGKVDHLKEQVSGLKNLGRYKFSVQLKQKNPLALFSFAVSSMSIVPHEAIAHYGKKFRTNPVGTGPFTLQEYRKKQKMTLVKNPNYHMTYPTEGAPGDAEAGFLKDAGKQLPLVDRIVLDFIPEAQPTMLKFQKGEISWVGLDKDNFTKMAIKNKDNTFELKPEFAAKYSMYTEPALYLSYMSYNMKDKRIGGDNKLLRQAISYAINPDEYINLMRNGRGMKLGTVVPHPIGGSERQIGNKMFTYNPEKAKELLKQAGYPDGKGLAPITLLMAGTSSTVKNRFEYFRASLAKIGIKLKPNYLTFPKYLKAVDGHNFEMAMSLWGADYPDAENFYQLFYGKSDANIAAFNHAEFDKLYDQIRYMQNGPARYALFEKMSEILKDQAPVTPIYNELITGLIQKWVRNFKRNIMVDDPFMYMNIDSQRLAKAEK